MQNVLVILGHIRLSVNIYGIYFEMKSRFLLEFENINAVKSRIKKDSTNQKAQFDKLCGLSYP